MSQLRPNQERASTAVTLLWIMMAINVLMLISHLYNLTQYNKVVGGMGVSFVSGMLINIGLTWLPLIQLFCMIIAGVTFIRWFRRAYFNLHQKIHYLNYSEKMAIWSWFIPMASLFIPLAIMRELYRETKWLLDKYQIDSNRNLDLGYVGSWWAFWIIYGVVSQIVVILTSNFETIEGLIRHAKASMVVSVICIIATGLAIKVVKDYASVEQLLNLVPDEEESAEEIGEAGVDLSGAEPMPLTDQGGV